MTRPRILLVGADPGVAASCSEYFRLRFGRDCEVESIAYCDDALQALSEQRFDLMLLFSIFARWRKRPAGIRFDGIELLKQMRARDIQVPVLVVSASLLPEAKRAALANDAFAFAPFDAREIDRLVSLALSADRHATERS